MKVWRPKTAYASRRDGDWDALMAEIAALPTVEEVEAFYTRFLLDRARNWPTDWIDEVKGACEERRGELRVAEAQRDLDRPVGEIARLG